MILRIRERTAYELCRTSRLGGAGRVGGQWRIEKTAFEEWVRRGGGSVEPGRKVSGSNEA